MFVVGLTGGIASGKTSASNEFARLSVPVIDADVIAREVVEPNAEGLGQLVEHFGESILNEEAALNRAALRTLIFNDDKARAVVDQTLHPLIRKRSEQLLQAAEDQGYLYAIYVVPLLVETGQQNRFDRILVIDVPRELQLTRLIARDNTDENQANAILDSQASREERLAVADDIIQNDQDPESLLENVRFLHRKYQHLAHEKLNSV
ncbi:MAG: dephospho-CoA kinase [Gammaproteobacteria bacterium]|nr:dephospho-CoA kinase [Gammaproteobacteria bacterium]